jgi:hypothetical protein
MDKVKGIFSHKLKEIVQNVGSQLTIRTLTTLGMISMLNIFPSYSSIGLCLWSAFDFFRNSAKRLYYHDEVSFLSSAEQAPKNFLQKIYNMKYGKALLNAGIYGLGALACNRLLNSFVPAKLAYYVTMGISTLGLELFNIKENATEELANLVALQNCSSMVSAFLKK